MERLALYRRDKAGSGSPPMALPSSSGVHNLMKVASRDLLEVEEDWTSATVQRSGATRLHGAVGERGGLGAHADEGCTRWWRAAGRGCGL